MSYYTNMYSIDAYEKQYCNTENYKKALKKLKRVFGYNCFKPEQFRIIDNILKLNNVIAIMPTGYGKSLCFQLPPLLTKEIAIVISPLIALMQDQQEILTKLGINSCCYNSSLTKNQKCEMEQKIYNNEYQIIYITPETLIKSSELIDRLYNTIGICMLAIDEAHCISSYGNDFRPAYREIVSIRAKMLNVPILAMTATATDRVINDMSDVMQISNHILIKTSYDRPNLKIYVERYKSNTDETIVKIIKISDAPSIIYCITKQDTSDTAQMLINNGINARAYHGGLSKQERIDVQTEFMNGIYNCIVATLAFGMGINKPNIRVVIHKGCPQNIESYYQEIGRAGRDNEASECYMFYKPKDFSTQRYFIDKIEDPKYKLHRLSLLNIISKYVNIDSCRRNYILNYFGQETKADCKNCDICTEPKQVITKVIKKQNEHKLLQLLKLIMEIYEIKKYYMGKKILGLILKGSNSKPIYAWMKSLPSYGQMHMNTQVFINNLIDEVIELNYIEYTEHNSYQVLKCTQKGIEFGQQCEELADSQ
jgi:RecQ family ATP-dependent DNA helicase